MASRVYEGGVVGLYSVENVPEIYWYEIVLRCI